MLKTVVVGEADGSVAVAMLVGAEGGPPLLSVAVCPTAAFPVVADEMTAGPSAVAWLMLAG